MRAGETPYAVKRAATGLGLFATKPIPRGTKIIEYFGPRISNAEVEKSNGKYFFELNTRWSINGSGRENIARYVNHSCQPNAEAIVGRRLTGMQDLEIAERDVLDVVGVQPDLTGAFDAHAIKLRLRNVAKEKA